MKKRQQNELIAIALYQIMFLRYKENLKTQKALEEHLKQAYILKDENRWGFEDVICDALYGSEDDVEEFMKKLKEHAKIKK